MLVHQRLVKKSKKLEEKLIYLAKLGEEKMEKKQIIDELDSYVTSSKIWQTNQLTKEKINIIIYFFGIQL